MEGDIPVFNNVKDSRFIRMGLLGMLIVVLIGISYSIIVITKWPPYAMVIVTIGITFGSSIPMLIAWNVEYLRRPYKIEIIREGLVLHRHYRSKPDIIPWNQIICIYSASSDPSFSIGHNIKDGYLAIRDGNKRTGMQLLSLNTNIADAAREKYREVIGNYPPLRSDPSTIH